jgi:hypothetical protein
MQHACIMSHDPLMRCSKVVRHAAEPADIFPVPTERLSSRLGRDDNLLWFRVKERGLTGVLLKGQRAPMLLLLVDGSSGNVETSRAECRDLEAEFMMPSMAE